MERMCALQMHLRRRKVSAQIFRQMLLVAALEQSESVVAISPVAAPLQRGYIWQLVFSLGTALRLFTAHTEKRGRSAV